jgi:hypothetical protein
MSDVGTIDLGDAITLVHAFLTAGGVPADPTTVTLTIRDPSGMVASETPNRTGVGTYSFVFQPTLPGAHEVIWKGTGAFTASGLDTFVVRSDLGAALITVDDAAAVLGTTGISNTDLIARLAIVCSEHVQNYCGRRFLPVSASPSAKTFRARAGATALSCAPWDFQIEPGATVVIDPTGSAQTLTAEIDYYLAPENSAYGMADRVMLQSPLQWTQGATRIDVTATWGWPAVPAAVAQATALWVRDILRGVSAFPQAAQYEQEPATPEGLVPPAARQLLSPFRHWVMA